MKKEVPIWEKSNLTIEEAAAYAFQKLMAALEEPHSVTAVGCKTHCR